MFLYILGILVTEIVLDSFAFTVFCKVCKVGNYKNLCVKEVVTTWEISRTGFKRFRQADW